MDFILLGIVFIFSGFLGIVYYSLVPQAGLLRKRLPNKATPASIALTLIIGGIVWFLIQSAGGMPPASKILTVIFALLVFESFLLISMRWIKVNIVAMLISLVFTCVIFLLYFSNPTFFLLNGIIIFATLGAVTLLIRFDYISTRLVFIATALWVIYDIMFVAYILPQYTVSVSDPYPTFLFPAITTGDISIGSGDIMFLILFTFVLLRDFNKRAALIMVVAQAVGLLLVGLIVPEQGFTLPYLIVMVPIFLVVYSGMYVFYKKKGIS